jgi:hypothetical protein
MYVHLRKGIARNISAPMFWQLPARHTQSSRMYRKKGSLNIAAKPKRLLSRACGGAGPAGTTGPACLIGTKRSARSSHRMVIAMVMNDSDKYRKFAEQCRKQAGQCKMPGERDLWLAMADEWEALAKSAESLPGALSQKSKAEGD